MPKLLDKDTFESTLSKPMQRVALDAQPPVDIWPYVEQINGDDFEGYDCTEGRVEQAFRNTEGTYEHVLISSHIPQTFMVIVVDLQNNEVFGHRLVEFALKDEKPE